MTDLIGRDPEVEPLRVGIRGAARITELALIKPAKINGTRLVAVAARDPQRAYAFAQRHGIEKVHRSYLDVINDPDMEVIYNALPNSVHGPWNKIALAAGKHVFTEKPSASNAAVAQEVAAHLRAPIGNSSRGSTTSGTHWWPGSMPSWPAIITR